MADNLEKKTVGRLRRLFGRGAKTKFVPSGYRGRFVRQRRKEALAKGRTTLRTKDITRRLKDAGLSDEQIARLRGK